MNFAARGLIYTIGAGLVLFGFGWVISDGATLQRHAHPAYWLAILGGLLIALARRGGRR
jgi:hypothetical protein